SQGARGVVGATGEELVVHWFNHLITDAITAQPLSQHKVLRTTRSRRLRREKPYSDAMIDLRSDTVTRPTPAMGEAIARAEVGDDIFGDDPTVRALEERVADVVGKEAALFVPSGTMGNQLAIALHTRPGDEVIVGEGAHLVLYEAGAGAG